MADSDLQPKDVATAIAQVGHMASTVELLDHAVLGIPVDGVRHGGMAAEVTAISSRLNALETDREQRVGRNSFLVSTSKSIGVMLTLALGWLGIKSQSG